MRAAIGYRLSAMIRARRRSDAHSIAPLVFVVLSAAACSASSDTPSAPSQVPRQAALPPRPEQPLYDFHSGFWLNTHLRLHYAATGRRPVSVSAPLPPDVPAWREAVGWYTQRYGEAGGFSGLFDEALVA